MLPRRRPLGALVPALALGLCACGEARTEHSLRSPPADLAVTLVAGSIEPHGPFGSPPFGRAVFRVENRGTDQANILTGPGDVPRLLVHVLTRDGWDELTPVTEHELGGSQRLGAGEALEVDLRVPAVDAQYRVAVGSHNGFGLDWAWSGPFVLRDELERVGR